MILLSLTGGWAYCRPTQDPNIVLKVGLKRAKELYTEANGIFAMDLPEIAESVIQEDADKIYDWIYGEK